MVRYGKQISLHPVFYGRIINLLQILLCFREVFGGAKATSPISSKSVWFQMNAIHLVELASSLTWSVPNRSTRVRFV